MTIIDSHLHLSGSISLEFLKETAIRNGCLEIFEKFQAEENLWKKFGFINQIIQTPEDITLATVDVVKHSTADILEIRTSPKALKDQSTQAYVQAFIKGLVEANKLYPHKRVRGLLSIDRSRHSFEDAKWIIDAAVKEKQSSGMIVGIDLSGNFIGNRTLTGNDLYEAIKYALSKDIGLALHVGEVDSDEERQDFDLILKAIEEYKGEIYGKVRLGHAVYRTKAQDEIIGKRKIPVEICPSCHRHLGWWEQDKQHPILTLYQRRSHVIPGTDDTILFGSDAQKEQFILDEMTTLSDKLMKLPEEEQRRQIAEKRKRYLF